jgi:hypothetical protein
MKILSLLLLIVSLASPSAAQTPPPKPDPAAVKALAVNYEISSADGTRKCPLTLDTKPVGQTFALNMNRQVCGQILGFMNEVISWHPGAAGAILLLGQNTRVIAEFTEGVGGVYEALREGDGVYFLANLQFVDPSSRVQAADVFGEWNFIRPGGGPICRATLTDEVAGEEMFAVKLQPKCEAAIEKFAPVAWKLQRGDLVLLSATGDSLRFERQENTWNKVPEKPRPLLMRRP